MNIQTHPHWSALQKVYHRLVDHGHKAYLAGGCVRDSLLGHPVNDLDVATDATPEAIERIFPKTVAVGKAFGVMLVIEDGISFEVATFRSDGSYRDGRHPESVVFTTPEEDAQRRDFTMNALFYDLHQGRVLDFVGGVKDLEKKIIKAVGIPEARFKEDHLRLLRAVRFAAQLGFKIESETLTAVGRLASSVKTVSCERVHEEIFKLLKARDVLEGLRLLQDTGLGESLFQGWSRVYPKSQAIYQLLFQSPEKEEAFLWMSFLAPWALQNEPEWEWILETYRFSRNLHRQLQRALKLLENPTLFFASEEGARLVVLGEEGVRLFLKVCRQLSIEMEKTERLLKRWQSWGEKMPAPWVKGEDLKAYFTGRELGGWLHQSYVWQLEERFKSREEILKELGPQIKK